MPYGTACAPIPPREALFCTSGSSAQFSAPILTPFPAAVDISKADGHQLAAALGPWPSRFPGDRLVATFRPGFPTTFATRASAIEPRLNLEFQEENHTSCKRLGSDILGREAKKVEKHWSRLKLDSMLLPRGWFTNSDGPSDRVADHCLIF